MKLPDPAERYDKAVESERKRTLETEDMRNYKRDQDVQIGGLPADTRKQRLILIGSVNGNRYSIGINDTTSSAPVLTMTLL